MAAPEGALDLALAQSAKNSKKGLRAALSSFYEKLRPKNRVGLWGRELRTLSRGEWLEGVWSGEKRFPFEVPKKAARKLAKKFFKHANKPRPAFDEITKWIRKVEAEALEICEKKFEVPKIGHVTCGNLAPDGSFVGGHSPRWIIERVEQIINYNEKTGVYKVALKGKKHPTTLFPTNMTDFDIIDAIYEAWQDVMKKPGFKGGEDYVGRCARGFKIRLGITPSGTVTKAYPLI